MAVAMRWQTNYLMFILCFLLNSVFADELVPRRKFEYKYSFKPPYLAQTDGSVPFWEYGGNAIASSENVRLAPSLRSQKGAIWTKNQVKFDWWEIDLVFRVTGRGRVGADGLALWYTSSKGAYDGTVFGSSDQWNGLGIFFDSFDNDNKHNNPYIMAVVNDGTKTFDHANDGASQMLAGCLRDFRNKPFPTKARLQYYQNTLTLLFHGGMTNSEHDYEVCFRVENVLLPKEGYFGVSAATGGLADDHDAYHFLTTSLQPPSQGATDGQRVANAEETKLSQEYQEYQKQLDKQKEEYRKEHPDERREDEFGEWFESDNQRELRLIFAGQSQTSDAIRDLNKKLDHVIGTQERSLSIMASLQSGDKLQGLQPNQQLQFGDSIRRQEVDVLLSTQASILHAANDIKSLVTEIHVKADNLLSNQARSPTAQVQTLTYDYQSFISEMRDGLNILKRDIAQTNAKLSSANLNAPPSNCVSTSLFLFLTIAQMLVIIGYCVYRNSRESQAKKFY